METAAKKHRSGAEWLALEGELRDLVEQQGRGVGDLARIYSAPPAVIAAVLGSLGIEVMPARIAREIAERKRQQQA